jgi:2-iminobutanoate/2-iminopropanoate deaminase
MVQFQNPEGLTKPAGYSHVAKSRPGAHVIYIAGQLPFDRNGNLVGANDFRAQAIQTLENVRTALAAAGAEFRDVVKLTIYLTDMSKRSIFQEVRASYLNMSAPPAGTLIGIATLSNPQAQIEVEAVAVLEGDE